MSSPEDYTEAQASDPGTEPAVLGEIATHRPDLRPAIAGNPTAYPDLLDWLANLNDPAVNAALALALKAPLVPCRLNSPRQRPPRPSSPRLTRPRYNNQLPPNRHRPSRPQFKRPPRSNMPGRPNSLPTPGNRWRRRGR